MPTEELISIDEFCVSHGIEISFISVLNDHGLIEMRTIRESTFISVGQLPTLEKIIRLYYELDINLEGIETITHLLQRINTMQSEITYLKNKLRLYEDG